MLQNPHGHRHGRRRAASKTGAGAVGAKILAQRGPSSGVSAKKLAQQAQKQRFSPVSCLQGELYRARTHARSSRATNFAHRTHKHGDVETDDTTAHPQEGTTETGITSAPKNCTKNTHFPPAKAMTVSIPHGHKRAKATMVSDHRATWSAAPKRDTRGRRRGLAGQRADAPNHTSTHPTPLVWRAPEGPAAVPVGGGGAWPDNEPTRRAKLAARTARGRAAAHRHTQRPALRHPEQQRRNTQRKRAAARRAAARSRNCTRTQRSRAATTSATWTAFRAAPLRRLSPETTRTRPRLPSTAWS